MWLSYKALRLQFTYLETHKNTLSVIFFKIQFRYCQIVWAAAYDILRGCDTV